MFLLAVVRFAIAILFAGLTTMVVFSACTWKSTVERSILVIFVENLGFSSFSCSESAESGRDSGFQAFCDQGVRFTHAYTPSTMSQGAIASVFTGLDPHAHGLRHNGAQALSAKFETVAEAAWGRDYKTAFFSGGPPIWRRSGLAQGFEVFDDAIPIQLRGFYRPASEVVRLFLNWRESEAGQDKSLSFLFLSDLQFVDAATTNELGEVRESSFSSQLDVVDEALGRLVKEMKRRKTWDSTDVFLVGLQADPSSGRPDELPAANLFSEATRVTLMIKPARKARDGNFNWKIDANVSLIDVGATLFDLIGAPRGKLAPSAESLKAALSSPQPDWPHDRLIITESAWGEWRGAGTIRASVRQGPYLFIFDEAAQIFNTLTDNLESSALPFWDPNANELRNRFGQLLRMRGFSPWKTPARGDLARAALGRELWRDREPAPETIQRLRTLSKRYPEDPILRAWHATWALRQGDWSDLKTLSAQPMREPTWEFVALRNLAEKASVPSGPCFEFLRAPGSLSNPQLGKDCRAEGLAELLAWANEASSEFTRNRAMDAFLRIYIAKTLASRIAEQNQVVGSRWDAVPLTDAPDTTDLILALPEFRKYRAQVRARIQAERR